ncbi:hypothetical protein LX64_02599 [Chitinophaga skermanii]|uniref:Uncharacterized protein n=1 Tax=Chitinophaga skermanii TaxID=331697 RepID=A0A327QMF0_9BACT|nr:DUF6138 family protein [Chitinophaga skermanii]RAJ05441.1 hypothetical protein LX64_02599 [Chitinophaga skermanii]
MNKAIETIVSEIVAGIKELIVRLELKRNPPEIIKRSPLQVGIFSFTRFEYAHGKLKLFSTDLDFGGPDLIIPVRDEQLSFTEEEWRALDALWLKAMEEMIVVFDENAVLDFNYTAIGTIGAGSQKRTTTLFEHTSVPKQAKLQNIVEQYIASKVVDGEYPTKELDTFFLSRHLLNPALYGKILPTEIMFIYERILALNKENPTAQQEHRRTFIQALRNWVEETFLPLYFNIQKEEFSNTIYTLQPHHPLPDPALLELVLFTAGKVIRHEANYMRSTGIEFIKLAGQLGSKTAPIMLQSGSGKFEAIVTKDVKCTANDTFGTIQIHILQEKMEAYQTALQYIIGLLENGFPRSYSIQLKAKSKHVLPIKKLGKTPTHQFFANALQYPELHPLLAKYATTAMLEYEWYDDAADEYCAMPGTYAVFGLALASPAYFDLVKQYMEQVDEEHQSVQNHFTIAWAEQYGVTPTTIPTLVNCMMACQEMRPPKLFAQFETTENITALQQLITGMEDYEQAHIVSMIWGDVAKLKQKAKKKDAAPALLGLVSVLKD